VVGDRVAFGPVQLVVMAVEGDRVTRVGMKFPEA
jgi:NhaP-type Na+/H+ and K+/H+ antiporter